MSKNAETLVQDKVIKYLKQLQLSGHPLIYERRQAGGLAGNEGAPDLWACYNGIHIEIEMKVIGGVPSPKQESFERKCRNFGILYIRPMTYKEAVDFFEKELIPAIRGRGTNE